MANSPCRVTIETFFFPGADLAPSMDTALLAGKVTAEPPTVPKAFQANAAVPATDAVIIAYSFGMFT